MPATIRLGRVTECGDLERIQALAHEIWREHYPGIISAGQIEYMLERQYSLEALRLRFGEGRIRYDLAFLGDNPIGYSAYEVLSDSKVVKLQSLYVKSAARRSGCGRALLDRVVAYAKANQCVAVTLTVNRNNTLAIQAYRRFGFSISRPIVTDIGGGYVMDDHLMEMPVGAV